MPTIGNLFNKALQDLKAVYDEREAANILYLLLADKYGIDKTQLLLGEKETIDKEQEAQWADDVQRLLNHEPVQYVTGRADFYGMVFRVDKHVLIPRPETEELVHAIINDNKSTTPLHVLDMGTGSGCIAIALAKNISQAQVTAVDVSPDALQLAKENAATNHTKVNFVQMDFLSLSERQSLPPFDLIVSNPPYISNVEAVAMAANVLKHEPHLALFPDGDDPLVFYKAIAQFAQTTLRTGGSIYLELNASLSAEIAELFRPYFKNVTLQRDMQGKDRILKAC